MSAKERLRKAYKIFIQILVDAQAIGWAILGVPSILTAIAAIWSWIEGLGPLIIPIAAATFFIVLLGMIAVARVFKGEKKKETPRLRDVLPAGATVMDLQKWGGNKSGVVALMQKAHLDKRPPAIPDDLQPNVVTGKTLFVYDIPRGPHSSLEIYDRTFENCTILGPAIVAPLGSVLHGCNIRVRSPSQKDKDAVLWRIPKARRRLAGVIAIRKCTFKNCTFDGIGFAGDREIIEQLKAAP